MIRPPALRLVPVALAALAVAWIAPARSQTAPPAGCVGTPSGTWINVAIQGVRSGRGLVALTLYADDAGKFLAKHGSLYTGRVPARTGTTDACLYLPAPGTYAIASYHDENASRKLDRNAIGLPKEAFGFSNNPSTLFGIPSFQSVRLAVPRAGLSTRIKLRYP